MNLEELVEELRENVLRDASTLAQGKDDALYTDKTLVRYINDAQVKFATRTLCLRDETTPEVTRVTLVEGREEYDLSDLVVAVLGVRVDSDTCSRHLARTTYGAMVGGRGDRTGSAYHVSRPGVGGGPAWFYTDRETSRLGVYPAPGPEMAGEQLVLRVARKPLVTLVPTDMMAVPEIPEGYHLDLLEWAAWRALRNNDADVEAIARASAFKKRFNEAVEELSRQAKRLLIQDIQFDVNTNWR